MTNLSKYALAISSIYVWIGFVCAISFMEAWLKFQAPGVTLKIGLGIGRIVFSALNKVEWVFVLAILVNLLIAKVALFKIGNIFYFLALSILALQTIYVLPSLDTRAVLQIQGKKVATSNLHFYYVGLEIIKVVSLFMYSLKLIKYEK